MTAWQTHAMLVTVAMDFMPTTEDAQVGQPHLFPLKTKVFICSEEIYSQFFLWAIVILLKAYILRLVSSDTDVPAFIPSINITSVNQ